MLYAKLQHANCSVDSPFLKCPARRFFALMRKLAVFSARAGKEQGPQDAELGIFMCGMFLALIHS
jgi:hypothetical protein